MSNENNNYYVGLYNQGSTCYLNSLMQTLFMTPEFRNAIYSWIPPPGKNDQCLLQQMQKLFLKLQISKKSAIDTKQFTNSLGRSWAFSPCEQRDAHDFLRSIFDTLEQIWQKRGTEGELSPVQKFYRGKVDNYIKCTVCGEEDVSHESFLDIPLAIKNFDSSASFTNIGESLSAYLQPQNLDNEEDFCEHCNNAGGLITGYRIKEFPRVLTLQLKRFEFDRHSMQRYKLNDRMEFDEYLDLSNYIHKNTQNDDRKLSEFDDQMEPMDCSNTLDGCSSSTMMQESETFMYELFAVIAHNGSLTGGHYFSYIRDLDADRWLCYNDSDVRAITLEEVFNNTIGVAEQNYWQNHFYGTSAYVLMYRKVFDDVKRERFMPISAFPTHLNAIKEKLEKEWSWDTFMKSKKLKNSKISDDAQQNKNQPEKVNQQLSKQKSNNNEDNNQNLIDDQKKYGNKKIGNIEEHAQNDMENIEEKNIVANFTINRKGSDQHQKIEIILAETKCEVMANITLKNNCHEKQQKEEKSINKKEGWVLIGNDCTLMEKLKETNILCKIQNSLCLLDLTMDIIKKLEHIQLAIRPTAQVLRSGQRLLSELKINCEKLNWDLSPNNEIFSSNSMHVTFLSPQGRSLFTNWLKFLIYISTLLKQDRHPWLNFLHYDLEQNKIRILLERAMCFLMKFAEKVPKNEVKAVSTEICNTFKFYTSRTFLLMNMNKLKLTDEIIRKSELIQRVIFTMLCILFELNSRYLIQPSLETLLSCPWINFLRMNRSELKFNPIEEYSPIINGNEPTGYQLLYHHFYALFHYNSSEELKIFNNDSVAYLLANYQNYVEKTGKVKETSF